MNAKLLVIIITLVVLGGALLVQGALAIAHHVNNDAPTTTIDCSKPSIACKLAGS